MKSKERNRVLFSGIFISIGLLAVLDNVFSHWLFKWHRILPNETLSEYLEVALFILGLVLLGIGLYREIKDRRTKGK